MYSLPRIRNISLLEEETFTLPASADFRQSTDGSYLGAYSEDRKRRYRIAFYNDGALRVQERLWAADQRVKEIPDGIILSFTSSPESPADKSAGPSLGAVTFTGLHAKSPVSVNVLRTISRA